VVLHGPRGGADARVGEELALEVDRSLVEQCADHAVGIAQPPDRARALPLDPVLRQHGYVPDPEHDLGAAAT
jgi:hypothetical protein